MMSDCTLPRLGNSLFSPQKKKDQPYKGWVSLGSWVAICKKKKELVFIHNHGIQKINFSKSLNLHYKFFGIIPKPSNCRFFYFEFLKKMLN
jgi:hypothetical protein